jgi:hypothetical protein
MTQVAKPTLTSHNGDMNNNDTIDLGMYTDGGNLLLAKALIDALRVPAHEFPRDGHEDWFTAWVKAHPVHSGALARHTEWTDTDVMDRVVWALSDPERGMRWLTS